MAFRGRGGGLGGVLVPAYRNWLLNFQDFAMQVLNTAIIKKLIM